MMKKTDINNTGNKKVKINLFHEQDKKYLLFKHE